MSSPNYSTASSYSPCQSQNYPPQAATVTAQPHYHNYSLGPYKQYEKIGTLAGAMSPELTSPTNVGIHERPTAAITANANQSESPQLSPVFKSEAAKQIIKEMTEKRVEGPRRRQIPREKRRHYTVSSSKPVLDLEDTFSKMVFFCFIQFLFSLSLSLPCLPSRLPVSLSTSCHSFSTHHFVLPCYRGSFFFFFFRKLSFCAHTLRVSLIISRVWVEPGTIWTWRGRSDPG